MFSDQDEDLINLDETESVQLATNDLFDWLLWIDHTLETQHVVVDDLEQTEQLIKKYDVRFSNINFKIRMLRNYSRKKIQYKIEL